MPKAHRPPGEPNADSLGSEIARLRDLHIEVLRVRWRTIFRRDAPPHLPRHLLFAMIAYRLHFEEANVKAVEIARSGKLGNLRAFNSLFTMQVKEGDIRLQKDLGGGTLYDIGIYCINEAAIRPMSSRVT